MQKVIHIVSVSVKVDPNDVDNFPKMIELWFMFSLIWSICCSVDEEARKKIDAYLREIDGSFPNKDSIYEYYVEPKTRSWIHWEEKLKQGWKLNPRLNNLCKTSGLSLSYLPTLACNIHCVSKKFILLFFAISLSDFV